MKMPSEEPIPPLPTRGPISNQAIALARTLWDNDHCTDLVLLERVAAGLREPEDLARSDAQREVDVIIARYRAAHGHVR